VTSPRLDWPRVGLSANCPVNAKWISLTVKESVKMINEISYTSCIDRGVKLYSLTHSLYVCSPLSFPFPNPDKGFRRYLSNGNRSRNKEGNRFPCFNVATALHIQYNRSFYLLTYLLTYLNTWTWNGRMTTTTENSETVQCLAWISLDIRRTRDYDI